MVNLSKDESSKCILGRHRVRDRLVSEILTGKHRPGQRLNQLKLAAQLGVAQSAVREALIELQFSGLIKAIDNRGMFVSDLSPDHIIEAMEVRERMEGLIAARCCQRITRAQVQELRQLAQRVFDEINAGRFELAAAADSEMHERLLHIAGNRMACRIAEQYHVVGKLFHFGASNRDHTRSAQQVLDEHFAVLQAIEDGNEQTAENLMRAHVRGGIEEIRKTIQAGQFQPQWLRTGASHPTSNS